jgi:hypothetical protein
VPWDRRAEQHELNGAWSVERERGMKIYRLNGLFILTDGTTEHGHGLCRYGPVGTEATEEAHGTKCTQC